MAIERKNSKTEGFEDVFELFDSPETNDDEGQDIGAQWVKYDSREYKFVARDPYGHWFIIPKKGTLPEELRGAYTTAQEAERHLMQRISIDNEKKAKKG